MEDNCWSLLVSLEILVGVDGPVPETVTFGRSHWCSFDPRGSSR